MSSSSNAVELNPGGLGVLQYVDILDVSLMGGFFQLKFSTHGSDILLDSA